MSVTMYNDQAKAELWKANTFHILKLRLYIFHQPGKVKKVGLFYLTPAIISYHMDIAECHNVLLNVSCPIRSETSQSLQCFSAGLWSPRNLRQETMQESGKVLFIKSEFSRLRVVFAFSPNLSKFPSSHKKTTGALTIPSCFQEEVPCMR